MTQINLTEKQKDLLRWIVQAVREDNLPEAGIRFTFVDGDVHFDNYAGDTDAMPIGSLSEHVLGTFQSRGFIDLTVRSGSGKRTFECTLRQPAYDAVDFNFVELDPRLKSIQLEPEQEELLATIVEASRNVPRNQREKFRVLQTEADCFIKHAGLPGSEEGIYMGDIEALARNKLIDLSYGHNRTPLFDVLPLGYQFYEYLKLRSGEPVKRIESEVRSHLSSETFRGKYSDAFQKWLQAESLLWGSDSEDQVTTIGHLCREAMQEFAEALISQHRPSNADPDKKHTKARVQAVLEQQEDRVGSTVLPFLKALHAYWCTLDALVQRQEHGAQREGESLKWEDARRVVFQTMLVMYEIDRTLA